MREAVHFLTFPAAGGSPDSTPLGRQVAGVGIDLDGDFGDAAGVGRRLAQHDLRHNQHYGDHGELDDEEGNRAAVDIGGADRLRRHALQVEQGEAEGRVHEGGLHVDREHDAEPDRIDAEPGGDGCQKRHRDEGDLEEIEEERQHEHHQVDDDEEAEHAAGQLVEQVLDPDVPIQAPEHQGENGRADEDEDDEGGQPRGAVHRLGQLQARQPPARQRQQQRAGRAHRPAFGGGGDAEEDGAEHQEDQYKRRQQRREYAQQQGRAVQRARRGWHGRGGVRPCQRHAEHVEQVQSDQRQAWNECALVHVADRGPQLVGEHDQHQRRRYDLRQRAGGGDDTRGEPLVVAVAQHYRQRDQPHRDDRGGDHAGGGGEQCTDQDDRVGQSPAQLAEQLADVVEQVLG